MDTYKWVGLHPQDLASGRMLAPGETCELSAADAREPHNAALLEAGELIKVHHKKKGDDE